MSAQPPADPSIFRRLLDAAGWPILLVVFIPIAIILQFSDGGATAIFITAALGVVPTAALMGRATEELAARSGPGIGGLLNVTFGNAPELIIALVALEAGLQEVVKASIAGSIIGNILLVLGASMFFGGLGRDEQKFSARAAGAQTSMLFLALAAIVMPAVYELVVGTGLPKPAARIVDYGSSVETLSIVVAVVMLGAYGAGLIFSLKTHRRLFNPEPADTAAVSAAWTTRKSVAALAVAGALVAVMSEILVGSIHETAQRLDISEFFIGAIIVAIVGNAAEHWVAVLAARKDQMNLAVNISIGSSAQIALFVAPVLILASHLIGPHPMALVFNGFELAALVLSALLASQVTHDGRSTWFEGLQLLAVYAIIGFSFFIA